MRTVVVSRRSTYRFTAELKVKNTLYLFSAEGADLPLGPWTTILKKLKNKREKSYKTGEGADLPLPAGTKEIVSCAIHTYSVVRLYGCRAAPEPPLCAVIALVVPGA